MWYSVMGFFCIEPASTEVYAYCHTHSLHDALPISGEGGRGIALAAGPRAGRPPRRGGGLRQAQGRGCGQQWVSSMSEVVSAGGTRGVRSLGCRSEEHTSELQSLMRISYAVFCLK